MVEDVEIGAGREDELRGGVSYREVKIRDLALSEARLRDVELLDCELDDCDLTLADLSGAALRGTTFTRCRLQGVDLSRLRRDALGISAAFVDCDLGLMHAHGLDLRACRFEGGHAREAQLSSCDLRQLAFVDLDLSGARFDGCDLRGADLRSARGYRIDPASNRVDGLRVTLPEALSFLGALGLRMEG